MNDKTKEIVDKLKTHCAEWTHFSESAEKVHDIDALNQLDRDMNDWFSELEDITQELENQAERG